MDRAQGYESVDLVGACDDVTAVVTGLAARHPLVTKAWVDAGYQRSVTAASASGGIDVEMVSKDPSRKG